ERPSRFLSERGRRRRGEPRGIEAELPGDAQREIVAIEHFRPRDVPDAVQITLGQLHTCRGNIGIVGRARLLIDGETERLARPRGANELVDEVLLLALGAVDHPRPDDPGATAGRPHRPLALVLAPAIDAEGARRVVLAEGTTLAVED